MSTQSRHDAASRASVTPQAREQGELVSLAGSGESAAPDSRTGPRERFRDAVRSAATYRSEDLGGEGTCGWLLSEDQFAAIFAAGDQLAAALIEAQMRGPHAVRPAVRAPGNGAA